MVFAAAHGRSSSLLVGTLVTLAAGLLPAWRATRVPPVAALRDAAPGSGKVRLPARAVRLLASLIGRSAERVGGSAGRLARRNAMRNPGRTAVTASALMIGVALVTLVTVVAQGLRDTTTGSLERRVDATHVVTGADGWSPTDPPWPKALATDPGRGGRDRRPPGRRARVRRQGDRQLGRPGDGRRPVHVRLGRGHGRRAHAAGAPTARSSTRAGRTSTKLGVGDRFSITSPKGDELALTVRGDRGVARASTRSRSARSRSRRPPSSARSRATATTRDVRARRTPATDLRTALAAYPDAKAQTKARVHGADDRPTSTRCWRSSTCCSRWP